MKKFNKNRKSKFLFEDFFDQDNDISLDNDEIFDNNDKEDSSFDFGSVSKDSQLMIVRISVNSMIELKNFSIEKKAEILKKLFDTCRLFSQNAIMSVQIHDAKNKVDMKFNSDDFPVSNSFIYDNMNYDPVLDLSVDYYVSYHIKDIDFERFCHSLIKFYYRAQTFSGNYTYTKVSLIFRNDYYKRDININQDSILKERTLKTVYSVIYHKENPESVDLKKSISGHFNLKKYIDFGLERFSKRMKFDENAVLSDIENTDDIQYIHITIPKQSTAYVFNHYFFSNEFYTIFKKLVIDLIPMQYFAYIMTCFVIHLPKSFCLIDLNNGINKGSYTPTHVTYGRFCDMQDVSYYSRDGKKTSHSARLFKIEYMRNQNCKTYIATPNSMGRVAPRGSSVRFNDIENQLVWKNYKDY